MDPKITGAKKVIKVKNLFFHARQPHEEIFDICLHQCNAVYSHFLSEIQNCSYCFNCGNKCPKLGTGTYEDMLFINLEGAT